jgi:endonuclease/exonuclease/phosphatase family metal-dependent hydrolase
MTLYAWSKPENNWMPYALPPGLSIPLLPSELQILSFNVWGQGDVYPKPRMHAILQQLTSHAATIICLQEMTSDMESLIARSGFIRQNYATTSLQDQRAAFEGTSTASNREEGVMLLIRKSHLPFVSSIAFYPFLEVSQQGRCGIALTLKDRSGQAVVRSLLS